jgi:hypothetical protein
MSAVIPANVDIQYSASHRFHHERSGILDHPLEPVIGLAEGETRWRMMTAEVEWGAVPQGSYLLALKNSRNSVAASLSPTAE